MATVTVGLDQLGVLEERQTLVVPRLPLLGLDRLSAAHGGDCRAVQSVSKAFGAGFLELEFLVRDLNSWLPFVELRHFVPAGWSRSMHLQCRPPRILLQCLFVDDGSME